MSELFALTDAMTISVILIGIAYFFAVHSPVFFALFIVWRQRRTMPRRMLFVGTVMGASYGILVVLFMVFYVPASAFFVFVAPSLKELGYLKDAPLLMIADFVVTWWWALLALAVLVSAGFISRYFAARWKAIVEALAVNPRQVA